MQATPSEPELAIYKNRWQPDIPCFILCAEPTNGQLTHSLRLTERFHFLATALLAQPCFNVFSQNSICLDAITDLDKTNPFGVACF